MGTTIIAVGLTYDLGGTASPTLVHVGDSRAYQLRDGALRQLSEDHSVAEEWVRMGRLTPKRRAVHPRRHQLTRGIGVEDTISIDVTSIHAIGGDRICSAATVFRTSSTRTRWHASRVRPQDWSSLSRVS